jgi:multiple sugar transport system permease protein
MKELTPPPFVVLFSYGVLVLLAVLYIAPIIFMFVGSLKPDDRILVEAGSIKAFWPESRSLQNYSDVFRRVDFGRYMFNSLFVATMIVAWGLVLNSLAGYAFARLRWHGRDVIFAMVVVMMIIPLEAIAVPLFYQVTLLGWRDSYIVQIVPFIANSFSIYLFYTFFLGLPKELEEAAHVDGAGVLRTFLVVIAPNAKPAFATVAVLTFLTQWGSFLWPLMVTTAEAVRPLPLGLAAFHTLPPLQWGDIFAFGVMMVAPILILFVLFQGWFVRGVASTGIKG